MTFLNARLVEPIERSSHIRFIDRRIAGQRLVDAPERPRHIVGDVACREFAQTFPCPPQSYPAGEQDWVDSSLRKWVKSIETHSTDQNHLCESRYNRHIFSSGKIPPAGETAAVWQMDIPRVPDSSPVETLSERIQREKRLIREQRENTWLLAQIVLGYEADWRTRAERDDLLRATKKARRSSHGLPPRSVVKDIDGRVPLNVIPMLKTGSLPQPSEALLDEWNIALYDASKDEKTPLKEKIDFYQRPVSEHGGVEHSNNGPKRSPDDEKVSERQFDEINYDGTRESGSWQGKEQAEPVAEPHRERWLEPRRVLFNPLGKKWSKVSVDDIADVTDHPDFQNAVGEYQITFCGDRVKDLAEERGLKPNTFTKRISRQELTGMYHGVDFSRTMGHYFCIVTLNGVDHLKILGRADAPLSQVLATFLDEWRKSEINAVKQTRKTARKNGVGSETIAQLERGAVERVQAAYETVIGVFVPDAEGIGATYRCYFGHLELLEAALGVRCHTFPIR